MDKKKRFKKKKLNSDDYKGIEQGAKATKGVIGAIGAVGLLIVNKDNIKTLGKGAVNLAKIIIKR